MERLSLRRLWCLFAKRWQTMVSSESFIVLIVLVKNQNNEYNEALWHRCVVRQTNIKISWAGSLSQYLMPLPDPGLHQQKQRWRVTKMALFLAPNLFWQENEGKQSQLMSMIYEQLPVPILNAINCQALALHSFFVYHRQIHTFWSFVLSLFLYFLRAALFHFCQFLFSLSLCIIRFVWGCMSESNGTPTLTKTRWATSRTTIMRWQIDG